ESRIPNPDSRIPTPDFRVPLEHDYVVAMYHFVAKVIAKNLGDLRGAASLDAIEVGGAVVRHAARHRLPRWSHDVHAVAPVEAPFHLDDAGRQQRAPLLQ